MKKIILLLFCLFSFVIFANAGNIVIYDTTTYRVNSYKISVNTPYYTSRIDVVINPDVSLLEGIPLRYWKYDNGYIVEMTQGEKDTVDTGIAEAQELGIRTGSIGHVNNFEDIGLLMRALVEVIRDEINILRTEHSLADRTLQQMKTKIIDEINSGDVD